MSAGLFLDVVSIMSGVLMLCVAFTILYNKLPEITDEWNEFLGRPRTQNVATEEQRRQEVINKAMHMHDIEATKPYNTTGESTPSKQGAILQVPTVESPESQDDSIEVCWKKEIRDKDNDDYVSKFMKDRKGGTSTSPINRCGSVADSCSVYLEGSCHSPGTVSAMEQLSFTQIYSPLSKASKLATASVVNDGVEDMEELSMVYSLDTVTTNPGTYASFARTTYSHVTNRIFDDDTTTCADIQSHPLHNNNITFASNVSEEPKGTVVSNNSEDSMDVARTPDESDQESMVSGMVTEHSEEEEPTPLGDSDHSAVPHRLEDSSHRASRDSFSPLARRNVTFSSTLDESSSGEFSKLRTDDSVSTALAGSSKRSKPKITIVTNRSLSRWDEDDDNDCQSEQFPDVEKEITPYTVSTTGMWSPSETLTPHDNPNESFSTYGDSLPSDEAEAQRKDDSISSSQNVHICKSASCTACRQAAQNTPTFLSTSRDTTGKQISLPRRLPNRWWDSQHGSYGQLKNYVSSVLLSQEGRLNRSLDEVPFDEA